MATPYVYAAERGGSECQRLPKVYGVCPQTASCSTRSEPRRRRQLTGVSRRVGCLVTRHTRRGTPRPQKAVRLVGSATDASPLECPRLALRECSSCRRFVSLQKHLAYHSDTVHLHQHPQADTVTAAAMWLRLERSEGNDCIGRDRPSAPRPPIQCSCMCLLGRLV